MINVTHLTLEAADPTAAQVFYDNAFGLGDRIRTRGTDAPSTGFRGFTISLIVSQPANVSALFDAAIAAGASVLKPVAKSLWGVGGVLQAPDGAIWKIATATKKDTAPASREVEQIVVLLGSDDVATSKRFYLDRGLTVGKSFGSYVEFNLKKSPIGLGLYKRRALAKDAGVPEEGTGSHRVVFGGAQFTDPDGFSWES